MAASLVDQQSGGQSAVQCESDGNFAVICSFFHQFSASLGISYNIQHLKEMIENTDQCMPSLTRVSLT